MLDAPADLRGRDLGAALRVASRVSLAEEAGNEEPRHGQSEHQRHRCDLSWPHAPTSPGHQEHFAPLNPRGEGVFERGGPAR